MMRKFSWMLLVFLVYAGDKGSLVVANAKELKEVKSKKIIWKKDGVKVELIIDGEVAARAIQRNLSKSSPKRIVWKKSEAETVLIPAGSFEMDDHFSEGAGDERPVHRVELGPSTWMCMK